MGINEDKVEQLKARARREVDAGLLPSCQVALVHDGEVLVDETYGDATPDNRYVIFSSTKAIVASTFWTLLQEGAVDVAEPVQAYVPEFMREGDPTNGARITVEQVLLHTSGFPHAPLGTPDWFDRDTRVARMAQWRCNWDPGTRYEYHATSAHWVLAEIIERVVGADFRTVVRERVLDPHGLDRIQLGAPAEDQADVLELISVGEEPTPDEVEAVLGIRELPVTEVTEEALLGFNATEVKALGVPGGGAVSDAISMCRFYQALLNNPKGVWDDELLRRVTSEVRNSFPDPLLGQPIERTLGLCTAGDDGKSSLRGFGKTVSPRAFGHGGAGGQVNWADPDRALSFSYLTNGLDAHTFRLGRRGVALSSIAGDCVTPT